MNRILFNLCVAAVAVAGAHAASAFDLNQALGVQTAYMCDTGDGKRAVMLASHPNCGKSKKDKAERWRVLSKAHCRLNDALASGNPESIQARAKELQSTVNRAKMYQRCYSTMKRQAKDLGAGYESAMQYILTAETGAPPAK
ncbi:MULTISPECIES: hypothetical protein [Variovorax]|uniref:hypothetical protein n=1 Tax=Variovorax TaxID=34072 RepID=UPI002855222A|nr:hypothetical protein [Variovorax sp. 3319]MDR6886158.1 hypothetical protein [Variovorax sp. 3319]